MTVQVGTAVWFAQHESRLAWRDWLSMVTAGRPERLRKVAIGIAAFIIFMHLVAYWVVGRYADAVVDKQTLVAVTASMLLSWMLMISQAMESITRAFYARSDLDLIIASPVATSELFGVRIGTVALATPMMALPLAAPFINVLMALGRLRQNVATGCLAPQGVDSATARSVAHVADFDADALSAAASPHVVAQFRSGQRRAASSGAGPGHGRRAACGWIGVARDLRRGRA
jgi:ABC-2 type transport system permease protein